MDSHYGAVIRDMISQLIEMELIIECRFEMDWVKTEFYQLANEDFEQNCTFCSCPNVHVIYEWGEGPNSVNKCLEASCLNRMRSVPCPSNCSIHCRNLALADGIDVNNVPMRVDKYDKGPGVTALQFIRNGTPFMRVTGMVRKSNGEQGIPSVPVAFPIARTDFFVDLTSCGCLARFMRIVSNELRPNAKLVRYNFNGYFHLLLVATADIAENSEIRLGLFEDAVGCGSERNMQGLDEGPSNAAANQKAGCLLSPASSSLPNRSGLKKKKKTTPSRNLVPQSVLDDVQREKERAVEEENPARQQVQRCEPDNIADNNQAQYGGGSTHRNGREEVDPDDVDTSGSDQSPPPAPVKRVRQKRDGKDSAGSSQQPPDPLPSTSRDAETNRTDNTRQRVAQKQRQRSSQTGAKGSIRCTCERCSSSDKPYDAPDMKALRKHLKTLPNKECPYCETSSTHPSNLTRHVKLHFSSKDAWKCPNPNCGETRLKKETFKNHIKSESCKSYNNQGSLTGDALEDYCNLHRTFRPPTKNKNGRPDISPVLNREWPGSYLAAVRLARELGYSNANADGNDENDGDKDANGEVEVEDLGYDCSEYEDEGEGRGNGEGGAGAGVIV